MTQKYTCEIELTLPIFDEDKGCVVDEIFQVHGVIEGERRWVEGPDGEPEEKVDEHLYAENIFGCTPEGDEVEMTYFPIGWKDKIDTAIRDQMQADAEKWHEDAYERAYQSRR